MLENKHILRFTIPLLHYCNLECSYCHVPNHRHEYMDFEIFKKGVDFFYSAPGFYKNIVLYGGEPLLLKDTELESIIDYAVNHKKNFPEKNIEVTLITNFMIYRDSLNPILEKVDNLCLSIDGQKKSHDVNRGGFDLTIKNFEKIRNNKKIMQGATINKVVNKNNVADFFDDVVYLYETFGLPISYNAALSVADWDDPSVEVLENQIDQIYFYVEKNNLFHVFENFFRLPVKSCPFGTLSMSLDGKVYNCEFIANDYVNSPEPVVDLKTQTLVKRSIKDCFYTVTSKRCEREDCLSCGVTCTKFSFQKNTPLSEAETDLLFRVKRTRQRHMKFFKQRVVDMYAQKLDFFLKVYDYKDVYGLFNFLFSLFILLNFKHFAIYTDFPPAKCKIIKKMMQMMMKKLNVTFEIDFIHSQVSDQDLELDIQTSFIYHKGKYLGNIHSEMDSFLFS